MEAVALGVGVRRDGRPELADQLGQAGQEPRELAAACPEMAPERLGLEAPREVVESGRVRPVRRPDDTVAVAVEHGGPLLGDGARELADEPALARPGLPRDERRAAALAGKPRQERPQRRKLVRPAGEGKRRRQAKRPGKRGSHAHR